MQQTSPRTRRTNPSGGGTASASTQKHCGMAFWRPPGNLTSPARRVHRSSTSGCANSAPLRTSPRSSSPRATAASICRFSATSRPSRWRSSNLPDPSLVVGQREITTSPAQALFLMNSPFIQEQSDQLARRLLTEKGLDDSRRVEQAFLAALSRRPTAAESDRVKRYLAATTVGGDKKDAAKREAWSRFAQSLLALPEFRFLF